MRCSQNRGLGVASLINEMWGNRSKEAISSPLFGLNMLWFPLAQLWEIVMVTILLRRQSCSQRPSSRSPPGLLHRESNQVSPGSVPSLAQGRGRSTQREQCKGAWEQRECGRFPLSGPTREVPFTFTRKYPRSPLPTQPSSLVSIASSRAGQMSAEESPVGHLGARGLLLLWAPGRSLDTQGR